MIILAQRTEFTRLPGEKWATLDRVYYTILESQDVRARTQCTIECDVALNDVERDKVIRRAYKQNRITDGSTHNLSEFA